MLTVLWLGLLELWQVMWLHFHFVDVAAEPERLHYLVQSDLVYKRGSEGRVIRGKALPFPLLTLDNLLLNPGTTGSLSRRCSPCQSVT